MTEIAFHFNAPDRLAYTCRLLRKAVSAGARLVVTGPAEALDRLDSDHARGETAVRQLQHLLLAWELLGESRRGAFDQAIKDYLDFYLEHMRLEETVILPEAEKVLTPEDWQALDAAFATNCDPLTGRYPRDPLYDRLFTRIVVRAPAPIGVGAG